MGHILIYKVCDTSIVRPNDNKNIFVFYKRNKNNLLYIELTHVMHANMALVE